MVLAVNPRALSTTGLTLVVAVIVSSYTVAVRWGTVPPPLLPPGDTVEPVAMNDVELSASIYIWQDFMPMIGSEGPPFFVHLRVNVTNMSPSTLSGFNVSRTTIYYGNTISPLVTFSLVLVEPGEFLVGPGDTVAFSLTNDRTTVFSPDIAEGTLLYATVLVVWADGSTTVLTSPECELEYTF
jgi:hypothetical protein